MIEEIDVLIENGSRALSEEKNPQLAIEYFLRVEKQFPNDAAIQHNLGVAYRQVNNSTKAIEHFTQAVRLCPSEDSYLLDCAESLVGNKKYGQAISLCKRFLVRKTECVEVQNMLDSIQNIQKKEYENEISFSDPIQALECETKYYKNKLASIESFIGFMKGKEIPKYPLDIFLEVSNVCDLKCIMCATFSSINPNRHHNISGTTRGFLDYSALQPMEELLKHALKVHCFGYGEPTINPKFREFIQYLSQYEVLIDFFTNGMHLTDDLVKFLVDNDVGDITVSFSGSTKVEYESAYQGGIFEQVLGGLARLRDRKKAEGKKFPRVSINSLAYKHHLEKFDQFVEMMGDHGVSVIYLKPLLECGNSLPDLVGQSALITSELNETVILKAKKIARERNIILSIAPELYVHNTNEEYERHVAFSGLTKDEYDNRNAPLAIEQFKELARNTKQNHVQKIGPLNSPSLDIEHATEEELKEILKVGETSFAHGDDYHFYCMEPFKTMYVLENGQTKPCCNVPSDTPAIGDVIQYGGEKVWNGKGFATYRNAILNDEYPLKGCENCLKFKTGPKTHFVDQMIREYFSWHSSLHRYNNDATRKMIYQVLALGDGIAIAQRFRSVSQMNSDETNNSSLEIAAKKSNLIYWQEFQERGYFENHPIYQGKGWLDKQVGNEPEFISQYIELKSDMNVAIIGCGYGRETAFIAPHVKHVYCIDVSPTVLMKTEKYLLSRGINNFTTIVADKYEELVPSGIDFVYSITVFQHLTRDLVNDYVRILSKKLSPNGKFLTQFLLEPNSFHDAQLEVCEPSVSWSKEAIAKVVADNMLKLYSIDTQNITETVLWYWAFYGKGKDIRANKEFRIPNVVGIPI